MITNTIMDVVIYLSFWCSVIITYINFKFDFIIQHGHEKHIQSMYMTKGKE
jgi:hypothetical protein